VRDEREIAAALAYARRENVPLGARSGGHGISGRSANDAGLAIALSRLASQTVLDVDSGLVRGGAGASRGDVAAALALYGLALSSGTPATSASAGWRSPAGSD
jgi:FAD/FMN-containing dehydrogenase